MWCDSKVDAGGENSMVVPNPISHRACAMVMAPLQQAWAFTTIPMINSKWKNGHGVSPQYGLLIDDTNLIHADMQENAAYHRLQNTILNW